ncbi:MAG: hypothetical protein K6G64_05720 [Eubacterium sp.]|nr:hypothetical protein [Eubacterium sp.]
MKEPSKKEQRIIFAITFLLFIAQGFFVGIHHEPWADEAQAWLIARDNHTLTDLINAVRYEGTPALWHIVVKLSQICGLTYQFFFLLPLFFSALGVLLLFRTKAPWYWKVFLPFTYYIAYQNTVVARSYSMVFPIMMLLSLNYERRKKKPLGYYLSLILLALTSSYGIIVSGSFLLYEYIGVIREWMNKKSEADKKKVYFLLASTVIIFFIGLMVIPPADCKAIIGGDQHGFFGIFWIITTTFIFWIQSPIIYCAVALVLMAFAAFYFKRGRSQIIVYVVPLLSYYLFMGDNVWHLTYLYYLGIFFLIHFRRESEDYGFRVMEGIVFLLIILQCVCGFAAGFMDAKNSYSGSEKATELIAKYREQGATIVATDYLATAVQPYFRENIFENHQEKQSYYVWSAQNNYSDLYNCSPKEVAKKMQGDVIVQGKNEINIRFEGYKKYVFQGEQYYKFGSAGCLDMIIWVKQ